MGRWLDGVLACMGFLFCSIGSIRIGLVGAGGGRAGSCSRYLCDFVIFDFENFLE